MKTASRIAAFFLAAMAFAGPSGADPFRVKNIAVDVTAANTRDSVTQGVATARQIGAERLIQRLTLAEDRNSASQPPNAADLARLTLSYDTGADEKRIATSNGARYIATLIVNFDAAAVRRYLDQRNIPYVDSQADRALIVPVAGAGVDASAWAAAWAPGGAAASDDTLLTPYVAATQAYSMKPSWADVQGAAAQAGVTRVVLAEAAAQGGQTYVRLSELRAGQNENTLATSAPAGDLRSAQTAAVNALEHAYKTASVVRTTGSTSLSLVASFRDLNEWVRIRKGLEGSRLVSNLNIESVSPTGADLSFVYAGRPDQLASDLRGRGVNLRGAGSGWVIEAAATQ